MFWKFGQVILLKRAARGKNTEMVYLAPARYFEKTKVWVVTRESFDEKLPTPLKKKLSLRKIEKTFPELLTLSRISLYTEDLKKRGFEYLL